MAVAITEQPPSELSALLPLWHRSAPRSLMKQSTIDGPFGAWRAWQRHLARRKRPEVPPVLDDKNSSLLWGWPKEWRRDELEALLTSPAGVQTLAITFSLSDAHAKLVGASRELDVALKLVALAYGMPDLAAQLPADSWWKLVALLHSLAAESQQYRVDWPGDPREVVSHQLLAGELPLALSFLFPEIRVLRGLRKTARCAFSEALIELTDGQGLLHARLLPVMGPLFACWTRARGLGSQRDRGPWSRKAECQYQWLVRNAIRLADDGGRFLLTDEGTSTPAWSNDLFSCALQMVGDRGDLAAAATALPRPALPKRAKPDAADLPDPSLNSDWSGIAVLSNGWSKTDVRLSVAYADDPLRIELNVEGERMLVGSLRSTTTCDGEPVVLDGEWERLCWESGKRYDFLELGVDLSHGLRLERQILLGRRDRVLYLADIVVSPDRTAHSLKHTIRLPLDDHDSWRPEPETRDGLLIGHCARVAVLPLGLNEWRAASHRGDLVEHAGHLVLTQETHGQAMCCPLLLDLDPKRAKKDRTWRQLTIAESLEIVSEDVAVGFRAQSGRDQWIFYRSLGPAGNRTLLGQNLSGEFSAGSFRSDGKYREWIEIEAVK